MNVFERLQEIFRDVFDDETLVITLKTSPEDIEDWDSLAQISIVSLVQEAFEIELEISEITDISDVGSIVDIIEKRRSNH